MKVAIVSESSANEAGARILVEALLNAPVEPISFRARSRGWPSVLQVLPAIIRQLHYHTDATGIVIVVDSDHTVVNHPVVGGCPSAAAGCRICSVEGVVTAALHGVSPVAGRGPLKYAVGLAVPALEAWLRCGVDPHVSEASWINAQMNNQPPPYTRRKLKVDTYGTDRPGLALETERTIVEATRLAGDTELIATMFPIEAGIRELKLGPIRRLDADGKPRRKGKGKGKEKGEGSVFR